MIGKSPSRLSEPPLRLRRMLPRAWLPALAALALVPAALPAQVHYEGRGPWNRAVREGPDAEVGGWYYHLGTSGLRVELLPDRPRHLLVRYVFPGSPAAARLRVGDILTGAGGAPFRTAHRNGYGMDKFGPDGPVLEFATALEAAQAGDRRLELSYERDGKEATTTLRLPRGGAFSAGFPADCAKTERIREGLLEMLVEQQREDGSWGSPPQDTFAPLALIASGKKKHLAAAKRNAEFHARTTHAEDDSWLLNWRYTAAAIVLSEYHLATDEDWVLPELEEIHTFLRSSQYLDLSQVSEKVRESHPDAWPKNELDAHGGWGHNPGFEGYGPIAMLTAQGALAFAMMSRCGIEVERERLDAAYEFLARGTGPNGYVWYEDQVAGPQDWADMGRTGAAALAQARSPYPEPRYLERARAHARLIGAHPQSFPDTHGSPLMGMAYTAAGAWLDEEAFGSLMRANRWWFTLAECDDGSFAYQPNRDNAGFDGDSRLAASAVTAFILSLPLDRLHLTRRP